MLHHKADGISGTAAPKTFVDLFGGGNGERRRFLVVEGAKAEVVRASFFQFNKASNDLDDIDPVLNLLYRFLGDHYGGKLRKGFQ
jgi:hypothetical protein